MSDKDWPRLIDLIIDQGLNSYDREKRALWWRVLQQKNYNETFIIPVYWMNRLTALHKGVHNFAPHPAEGYGYRYNKIWIEK